MPRHALLTIFLALVTSVAQAAPDDDTTRTAILPFLFGPRTKPLYDSAPGDVTPHPAVARIIVPEDGATAYGSGTLVGVRENRGLVVTNWHVVRDSTGRVEVVFPDGHRSHAKPLKVDSDWDLAALVIWKPNVEPVKIATQPPRPGEPLTIHGYGRGKYRIATGRCTSYLAPRLDFPHEMVELDVEARQGDSGGPIFNQQGELAGVLFGAGQGTTLGSFAPRVRYFLASVAPDIDQDRGIATAERPALNVVSPSEQFSTNIGAIYPSSPWSPPPIISQAKKPIDSARQSVQFASNGQLANARPNEKISLNDLTRNGWYEPLKTLLAAVGLAAISLRLIKVIR
jgi:hypothetical protein